MIASKPKAKANPTPFAIAGYSVIFLTFGVLGVWAATAKLDKAVVAGGVIDVSTNRKEIQHLEGGSIDKIFVNEGDIVHQDDVLIKLKDVQARANVDVITTKLHIAHAVLARLEAERQMKDTVEFPADLLDSSESLEVQATVVDQRAIFQDRKSILKSQLGILKSRIDQLKAEGDGLQTQSEGYSKRVASMQEWIDRLSKGVGTGVVAKNLLSEVQDRSANLQTDMAQIETSRAKLKDSIGEANYQILQVEQQYKERANGEYKDASTQVQELTNQLQVYSDILARTAIKAPVDGVVQNIRFHTSGGVARPGELLMEIVPTNDVMVIKAQVSPMDVDNIKPGFKAEVKFPSFQSRTMPIIYGKVETVSKGSITPASGTGAPYFLAQISVDRQGLPESLYGRLSAGMPAEVFISTGERTVANYIYSPLFDTLSKGMRED